MKKILSYSLEIHKFKQYQREVLHANQPTKQKLEPFGNSKFQCIWYLVGIVLNDCIENLPYKDLINLKKRENRKFWN